LDFEAKPGQFLAFVGPSGSGKTSIVSLIERFYDPLSGDVLMDGTPVSGYNLSEYRDKIGLVNQEPRFRCRNLQKLMIVCIKEHYDSTFFLESVGKLIKKN
jgi:ABC-type bacteriocin/lantibiotic exporter with double-glycine peptidase domain